MKHALLCFAAVGVLLGNAVTKSRAGEPPASDKQTAIEDAAREVLLKFADYLKSLPSLELKQVMHTSITINGHDVKYELTYTRRTQRPNRMYELSESRGVGALERKLLVCDGTTVSRYQEAQNRFSQAPAPADFKGLDDFSPATVADIGEANSQDPLSVAIASGDPRTAILELLDGAAYVGKEDLAGQACDHLRLVVGELSWDVWLTADETPAPVRTVVDIISLLKAMIAQNAPPGPVPEMRGELTTEYALWRPNAEFNDTDFAFKPPADAEKVEFLYEGMDPANDPAPLIGQAAPEMQLKLQGGGDAKIGPHKDRVTMILFCSASSELSHRALTKAVAIADRYRAQGVELQTVNVGSADLLDETLSELKLELPVALDDGQSLAAYKVAAVPQWVLVGRGGDVQAIHLGLAPDLEARIGAQLEGLLAGKSLAQPPPKDEPLDEAAVAASDARGREVIAAFAQYCKSLENFAAELTFHSKSGRPGEEMVMFGEFSMSVKRPNFIRTQEQMTFAGRKMTSSLVSDGTRMWWRSDFLGKPKLEELDAPGTLFELAKKCRLPDDRLTRSLFSDDPAKELLMGVERVRYVGQETLDERECDHVLLVTKSMDFDVWLVAGDEPAPVRLKTNLTRMLQKIARDREDENADLYTGRQTLSYAAWRTNVEFPADEFVDRPPAEDQPPQE